MFAIMDQPTYIAASLSFDIAAALLMAVILISLIGMPRHVDSRLRQTFIQCVGVGLITSVVDLLVSLFMLNGIHGLAISLLYYFEYAFLAVFAFTKSVFVFAYLGTENKGNRMMKRILFSVYGIVILASLSPSLSQMVSYVPEGQTMLAQGTAYGVYYTIMIVADMCVAITVLLNHKALGTKYTITLVFLLVVPSASFLLFSNDVAPMMFSVGLFMMVSYIIVYQKNMMIQIHQEKELAQKNYAFNDMQTKVLLSQIQPHFLYNTLTTIAYLCHVDPENAEKLTNRLSEYLRSNINFLTGKEQVPLSKELEAVENYLAIEKYRFEDRINVEYNVQVNDFSVPMLAVETVVENAVKHGICKRIEGGTIWISSFDDEKNHYVCVRDNGVGFDASIPPNDGKTHVGISNVKARLQALGGEMRIDSSIGEGTSVTLVLPKEDEA